MLTKPKFPKIKMNYYIYKRMMHGFLSGSFWNSLWLQEEYSIYNVHNSLQNTNPINHLKNAH